MTNARSSGRADRRSRVKELTTEGTLPALSRALVRRRIDPHAIITIVELHGQATASPTPPQFQVLYEVQ
jgi:hypothetical protein